MHHRDIVELTRLLSTHVRAIALDLRQQLLADGPAQRDARALHQQERVAEPFEAWTDLLSRRAAVLWVLKTVYLRVLEDRALLAPLRLIDEQSQRLFERLAPNLGESAYLAWCFRDLATDAAGLAELFGPQPAELVRPADHLSRALLDLWRTRDLDSGALRWDFSEESFDGRLMGDLYQELDPEVKARYALCQTPHFIAEHILRHTLDPAVDQWGLDQVRVLDPSCGSGHFLLDAFRALRERIAAAHPDRSRRQIVAALLPRLVGIDLNDYACALARARLLMSALEWIGQGIVGHVGDLHPQIFWADALYQAERDPLPTQRGLFGDHEVSLDDLSRAIMLPDATRHALQPVLAKKFHVVIGNPPYIVERDDARKNYHKDKEGKRQRYISATGKYSLVGPFIERSLQLAVEGGCIGMLVSNSFMKRSFGKSLVEQVLPNCDLTHVIDTSGAKIPHHEGAPTVILIARNQRPPKDTPVHAILGKRGEPGVPDDPAHGLVWSSIRDHGATLGFDNEYISVAATPRDIFSTHPWSLQGGGAQDIKDKIETRKLTTLTNIVSSVGVAAVTGEDEVFGFSSKIEAARLGIQEGVRSFGTGEQIRDYIYQDNLFILYPYTDDGKEFRQYDTAASHFWRYRTLLRSGIYFGKTKEERGMHWQEYAILVKGTLLTPLSIAFAFVATHNHFVLDRGGKVFKQTAPVIKLPPGASEEAHLALLAQLNSSTACFWMKAVFFAKGGSGEAWEDRIEHDGTKLQQFPVIAERDEELEGYGRALDGLGSARAGDGALAVVEACAAAGAEAIRAGLDARRARDLERLYAMCGLQEELDWRCYARYGLIADEPAHRAPGPDAVGPLIPGQRPFELKLADEDAARAEALARGEEVDQQPSAWFVRHGWTPRSAADPGELDDAWRARLAHRLALIESSDALALLEQPTYKRRWFKPDYAAQEREAMEVWLMDRLEAWAKGRGAQAWRLREAATALESDPAVRAVAAALEERQDLDLSVTLARLAALQAVPHNKHHVFKPSGLEKRARWEQTWAAQHAQDRGEEAQPEVPPRYTGADYQQTSFWQLRGKLDVPRERFIAWTSAPQAAPDEPLYSWAGLTPLERANVLMALEDEAERAGHDVPARYALLYDAWFLLPWVAWESPEAAEEYASIIAMYVGQQGPTPAGLDAWAAAQQAAKPARRGRAKKA